MADATLCVIDGCGNAPHARGLCNRHYLRLRRLGDPLGGRQEGILEQFRFVEYAASYQADDCLIWPYCRDTKGYGFISGYDKARGKTTKLFVHRRVCEIVHGLPPAGKNNAAHYCGRGQFGCVAGKHIRWASCQENTDDKIIHGTAYKCGGFNGSRKLVADDVISIRALIGKDKIKNIARKFSVSKSMISHIASKRKWAHV